MTSWFPLHLRPRAQFPAEAYHRWPSPLHADSQTNTPAHFPGFPMCERLLALPHCVPVLSAGHTRKSRVTVSSLAHFFLSEPEEQDLRAPVTGVCASSPPPSAQIIRGMWPPSPCYRFSTVRVCVWDVLYTHQIITEKLWTPPFCIWCMFKTLHISQRLWVPAVQDCVYNRQSLTTCNIHNIYSTNHAENNTLH